MLFGDDNRRCFVHKSLLRRRALKIGDFAGDVYHLPEVNPDIFELYVHHLYTGEIQCKMPNVRHTELDDDSQGNALAKLYEVAYDLGDEITKHAVLGAFLEETKRSYELGYISAPGRSAMRLVCDRFRHEEPLYRLFVDMYIWDVTVQGNLCESLYENLDPTFAGEVMKAACKKLQMGILRVFLPKPAVTTMSWRMARSAAGRSAGEARTRMMNKHVLEMVRQIESESAKRNVFQLSIDQDFTLGFNRGPRPCEMLKLKERQISTQVCITSAPSPGTSR